MTEVTRVRATGAEQLGQSLEDSAAAGDDVPGRAGDHGARVGRRARNAAYETATAAGGGPATSSCTSSVVGDRPRRSRRTTRTKPVVIFAGDTVVGGKQNRIINVTVWLPAAAKSPPIPVSCLGARAVGPGVRGSIELAQGGLPDAGPMMSDAARRHRAPRARRWRPPTPGRAPGHRGLCRGPGRRSGQEISAKEARIRRSLADLGPPRPLRARGHRTSARSCARSPAPPGRPGSPSGSAASSWRAELFDAAVHARGAVAAPG